MSNKIDGLPPAGGHATDTARARAAGKPVAPAAPTAPAHPESRPAATVAADSDPTLDMARIQAVRAALEAGTYRIDPQEIADRLANLERQLSR
ncbi:MAG: flagellar biosynthesis anti-sigma factor FlgM [Pseudomonadota bacterium]